MRKKYNHLSRLILILVLILNITISTHCTAESNDKLLVSFKKSAQVFDKTEVMGVALGDLNNDGNVDAVLAKMGENNPSTIWFNNGKGQFDCNGQKLALWGHGVALGDLDSDKDLDIFLARNDEPSKVYLNDGNGLYIENGQNIGFINDKYKSATGVQLADIDGDGDLDALVNYYNSPNTFWINDGKANFSLSKISFDDIPALGDLNNDGDIDIFLKILNYGYKTILNDGKGNFENYWEIADSNATYGQIKLGDFDGDKDLDAIITNGDYSKSIPTTIWYNDGKGNFICGDQKLGPTKFARVALGDLNNDKHLDVFISIFKQDNQVWINNGKGYFIDSGLKIDGELGCALGDLDNDGDLDIFVGTRESVGGIWFNKSID